LSTRQNTLTNKKCGTETLIQSHIHKVDITTTLTHNPKGYEYGKNNIYYITNSFNQNFGCVVEGVAKGDIFTIEVEGYKTVKVISKSTYKSPTFENLTILD